MLGYDLWKALLGSLLTLSLFVAGSSIAHAQEGDKGPEPEDSNTPGELEIGGTSSLVGPGLETQGNGNTYVLLDNADIGGPLFNVPAYSPTTVSTVSTTDDGSQLVGLGFNFVFYGVAYASTYISANGFLAFGGAETSQGNGDLGVTTTVTKPAIFAFWDDLNPGETTTGQVRYGTFGGPGARVFVVEYDDVRRFNAGTSGGTFQIRLFETSNAIEFHYFDLDWGTTIANFGASATVGLRAGPVGSAYLQYLHNSALIFPFSAIRLWRPTCGGKPATIVGDRGDDVLSGTALADVIHLHHGNDFGFAGGGDDNVCGGRGDDSLHGDDGDDLLIGGPDADRFQGGPGTDTIEGTADDDGGQGGAGHDALFIVSAHSISDANQGFRGDGGSGAAGSDLLVVRAGSIFPLMSLEGDGQSAGPGAADRILFAGHMLSGVISGDGVTGDGGPDFIAVLPAGDAELVIGDLAQGNGGNDTITIVGRAAAVVGDGVNFMGGNDTIAITKGATVAVRDPTVADQGWVRGDGSLLGDGGNDFMIIRGTIARGVMGDDTGANGGKDFMRIYPAAVINGNIIGDGGDAAFNGVFGRAGRAGGDDTVVAFAGATINGSIFGDAATTVGGNDKFSLGATIAGSVIGDLVTGDTLFAGSGGNDSMGIGGAGRVNGNLVGDRVAGDGGNDIFDISGTVVGTIRGDEAGRDGGNDIIFVRSTGRVGPIVGDNAGGKGGDDTIRINAGAVVAGNITGDLSTLRGGNDHIIVSGTVNGSIFVDDAIGLGGNDRVVINPAGKVNGNINASKGTNTIIVRGTVTGDIICSPITTLQILGGTVTGSTATC